MNPTHDAVDSPRQKTLFDSRTPTTIPPPANSTATSRAAAAAIEQHAPTQRERVLCAIIAAGSRGATNEELADALKMRTQSVTARRNELVQLGLIEKHGTRPGSSGRSQEVLIATENRKESQC